MACNQILISNMNTTESEPLPLAILYLIAISRLISEIIHTYFYPQADSLWAGSALFLIFIILWPYTALQNKGQLHDLKSYFPIILYLFYLTVRTNYFDFFSLKAFLSELIIWSLFLVTNKCCDQNEQLSLNFQKIIVLIIKIGLLFGLCQLVYSLIGSFANTGLNLEALYQERLVHSIFDHPNSFTIVTLPFCIYFLKKKKYLWMITTIFVCAFSGTRAPFITLVILAIPIYKLLKNKKLAWHDIIIPTTIILIIYSALIYTHHEIREYEDYQSRFNLASFEWRVQYWTNFLEFNDPFFILLGHGVGTAEVKGIALQERSPHNDYIRIFYDLGIIGLFIYLALIIFMFKLMMRSKNRYAALIYMFLITFSLTDNLIFFSYSTWVYMFLASISTKNLHPKLKTI